MALPVPNLDDRTFDQLAAEARGLIPKYFPEWTDHNPSDPGITLLELFAFLFESAIYQLNRVPERSLEHFAQLVGVARQTINTQPEPIEQTLRRTLKSLEAKYRAVTEEEFEALAKEAASDIARVKAIVDVEATTNVFPNEQSIKVILVPNAPKDPEKDPEPKPSNEVCQKVFELLRSRCPITTRVQVVEPDYTDVSIDVTAVRDFDSRLDKKTVQEKVEKGICKFLSPLTGGVDGAGWEFGRSVFRSELYQLIEGIAGVDHVQRLLLNEDEATNEVPLSSRTSLVSLKELVVTVVDA